MAVFLYLSSHYLLSQDLSLDLKLIDWLDYIWGSACLSTPPNQPRGYRHSLLCQIFSAGLGTLIQAFSPSKQQTFYQLSCLLSPSPSFSKTRRYIHDEQANKVVGGKQHPLATQGPDVLMLFPKLKKQSSNFFAIFEICI